MTPQQKIAQAVNAQTESQAMAVYSGLRMMVMRARQAGEVAPEGAAQAMVMAGEALETRIGADRFDALLDQIDGHLAA